ncbi:immunity 42 family protein [Sodalis ligni]|uniref:Immunity protein 42 of polymorphic toxin system n=1 Tax=Sodalis ligni TaxID=2697027 RepID=A0A4R1NE48_9GAMM|nr:immunity 42 family protein [Sodalis ligni]TCL05874.1 immunity protein 42 of polymorphic toxin system [Sodalis ligni]
MIFGQPFVFAVFYELLEKTEDNCWKYGLFSFFIEDEIYPSKGSNYTLSMAIDHLKDSLPEIMNCENNVLTFPDNDLDLLRKLAHSHGMLLESDPADLELPDLRPLGVFLSPIEISDVGFYLFYYPKDKDEEYLIYTADYGNTAKKTIIKKGTVSNVIAQLPSKDAII